MALLARLREVGWATVLATPHMRAGMFDTDRAMLLDAFERARTRVLEDPRLPEIGLACEHHLDDTVFRRLLTGEGIPYPGGRTALVELPNERFPLRLADRLFELRCKRIRPILAHPERCRPVWRDIGVLEPLLDGGSVLLLDLGSLSGRYGRQVRRCAEALVDAGFVYAACTDAHRLADVEIAEQGRVRLEELVGREETEFMLADGPRSIVEGRLQD